MQRGLRMNRIDRLHAILIQLQGKKLVKAQEIAVKFSISLRTVYRDIRSLEEGGVPIIGEAGVGYQLMEGYRLPPVMFTEDEASALLTASKLMESLSDEKTSAHYAGALDKIRAVLRMREKDHMAGLDEHVAVVTHPAIVYKKPSELHLSKILKAIASTTVLDIQYTSVESGETRQRDVEPVGIYLQNGHWYLIAWCRLRRDYRNFRTDGIRKAQLTATVFTATHPPLQSFVNVMSAKRQVQKVVIDVDPEVVKYFGDQKYYNGFVSQEEIGGKMRMTFLCGSLEGFARWFMLFGDHALIVEPVALTAEVTRLAENILKKVSGFPILLT